MSYLDSDWKEIQAGEYVLGTLDGDALNDFVERMEYDPELQILVVEWQETMQPMADATVPVVPPIEVWNRLSEQLAYQERKSPEALQFEPERRRRRREQKKLAVWQWAGSLALAASVVLALLLWQARQIELNTVPSFDVITIVSSDDAGALWVINAALRSNKLQVTELRPLILKTTRITSYGW